ncbi:MAG TPA: transglycosylase, partial [Sutterella sp.]|nr:transglycosylase [Sutterella sp.]
MFFQERKDAALGDGPVGSLGVPITPCGTVAVDSKIWPLGVPFIVQVHQDNPTLSFVRPVIAQDTGSAIRGPLRFDYFWGSGS